MQFLCDGDETTELADFKHGLLCETGLTLVSDSQYQNGVVFRFAAVERYIACLAAGYDQFAQKTFHRAPDQGVTPQDVDSLRDQFDGLASGYRISINQKVSESIEIVECAG
jgi:hypothetical protein